MDKSYPVYVTEAGEQYVLLSDLAKATGWSADGIAYIFRRLDANTLRQEKSAKDNYLRFAHIVNGKLVVQVIDSITGGFENIKITAEFAAQVVTAIVRGVTQLKTVGIAEFSIDYGNSVQPVQTTTIYDRYTNVELKFFVVALDPNGVPVNLTVNY